MQLTDDIRAAIQRQLTARPGTVSAKDKHRHIRNCHGEGGKWVSAALGVHPAQIEEAREHLSRCGVPTDFDGEGRAIITSHEHAKRIAKASGMFRGDHGFVQTGEDGRPVFTGTHGGKERQHFTEQARLYAAGLPCDPVVARKIERMAEE